MKKTINIEIEEDAYRLLKARAKKNLMDVEELIGDIIRRSMLNYKQTGGSRKIKVDDSLVELFSRERRGKKK